MTDDAHAAEMKKLQAAQRAKAAELRDPERGLVLVLTGDGKGKSSSAFGMAVRALGWGRTVGVVQFIKGDWVTGEKQFFDRLPEVTWRTMGEGFTWDTQDAARDRAAAAAAFAAAREMMASGDYDLILLDEVNVAIGLGQIDAGTVSDGVAARHPRTAVVLTGRGAPDTLRETADLVSEVAEVKHPFHAGIRAQRGLDY